jgi:hypothetical protein
MSSSQFEFFLLPTRRDALTKPFKIKPDEWQSALALCRKHGYFPPDFGSMSREVVRWLRRSLTAALPTITDQAARERLEKLIRFCESDGATGFTLERRWERAI